ncbi:iron-containing alcohol dehydrogenase [Clostridiaceae bacterium M8S5]|nr:iron-containing alcohol dehydrogenase [Clostridiaceae bacterium M8S5]
MIFQSKTEIHWGENSLKYLSGLKSQRAFVVADRLMVKLGLVKKVTDVLNESNVKYSVFDEVEPNPSVSTVTKGLHHIIKNKPDLLIAVGGGSVIDAAKAIMYFCIKTKEELVDRADIKKPWFVAFPTTSGTGSEVTAFSVVTDEKNNVKIPLVDNIMTPDVAVLDAEFTRTVPPIVTADTGMDVLSHAIESFVSIKASDYTDMYSRKAVKDVFSYLYRAYIDGDDMIARQKMQQASCMAGISFTNAGLGINHSLAHAIGGIYKISHGRINAMLLPYVIEFNSGINNTLTNSAQRYEVLADELTLPCQTTREGVLSLIEAIKILNAKLGIPLTLKEYGIDRLEYLENIDVIIKRALEDVCTLTNQTKVTYEGLKSVMYKLYG